jgi:hypothetical protein
MAEEFKEIDEKQFFDLLKDYKSDDFKRARRGLTITSFIVILIFVLELPIENLKFFGVGLKGDHGATPIYWIGLLLITYWASLFGLYWKSDYELQKEKQKILSNQLSFLEVELSATIKFIEDRKAKNHTGGALPERKKNIETIIDAHDKQKKRTESAQRVGTISRYAEISIPIGMGILAFSMLGILLFLP